MKKHSGRWACWKRCLKQNYLTFAIFAFLLEIISKELFVVERNSVIRIIALLLLAPSPIFIFLPFVQLKRYGHARGDGTYMDSSTVADRGLYGIVRHPQYLGYILLATGFALLSQSIPTVFFAALSILLIYLQIISEEKECLAKFGDVYQQYSRCVPRLALHTGLFRNFFVKR